MIVRDEVDLSKPIQFTEEQLKMFEALRQMDDSEIVFDEDCPEQTEEDLKQFYRVKDMPERRRHA